MTNIKKIALIELTTYHEECLYSQLKFLTDANFSVTLILNPKNAQNTDNYDVNLKNIKLFDPREASYFTKRLTNWFSLYQYIIRNSFDIVIFNTASSNKETIALSYFLPKRIAQYGIIHNLRKLNQSTSQKIVSKKLKKYYVLSDFLVNSVEIDDKSLQLRSFYPIFFPKYRQQKTIEKNGDFWICIPGELNYNRRDYDTVLSALAKIDKIKKIKIIILGKLDKARPASISFLQKVEELGLEKNIICFSGFIENEVFHAYIKESDFIMAPVSVTEKNYLKYKITGAYNLAFAYKKPLICPQELSIIPDLKVNSYFYENCDSLADLFNSIKNSSLDKIQLYQDEKWQFEVQQERYLHTLNILH